MVELFRLDARANITRAPLTSTLPSQTFDRLRVLTNTLPRLILRSPTTLCRLAVTVFSLTLAQPIPSKSNRPNGLRRSGSNPHCYWAQTAQTTQQPILPPTLPRAPRPPAASHMASHGTAHGRFQRAIQRRDLSNPETAAREMRGLSLAPNGTLAQKVGPTQIDRRNVVQFELLRAVLAVRQDLDASVRLQVHSHPSRALVRLGSATAILTLHRVSLEVFHCLVSHRETHTSAVTCALGSTDGERLVTGVGTSCPAASRVTTAATAGTNGWHG
jgi:hypothetical protein